MVLSYKIDIWFILLLYIIDIYFVEIERRVVVMAESVTQESDRPGRGPKKQPRRKALISMTAAEYNEFSAWAEEEGVTKAMLMHDMMGRERERRARNG